MRSVKRILAVLPAFVLLSTCSSPGSNLVINGNYIGTIVTSPRLQIHLTVSGSTITGTATVMQVAPNIWRGDPDYTNHAVFAGTRDGRQVTSLASTESHIQYDLNVSPTDPDWQDADVTLNLAFGASFNNNGGVTGNWQGDSPLIANPMGGTWSAVKESGSSGGIVRP
jgi:hypothetical protein